MTNKMKLLISLPVLGIALIVGGLGLLLLLSGCQTATTSTTNTAIGTATTTTTNLTPGTGVLEGKVWIGTLPGGPPEKLGLPYPPEIYQPRKIMVYDADHINLVKQVDITEKGYYSVELPAGKYTVDINHVGSDWSNSVPRKLTIQPGIHINFDIEFNIGADVSVTPSIDGYLFNSENKSSEVLLKSVQVERAISDKQYSGVGLSKTINSGESVLVVRGTVQNNHPTNKEIMMYAEGYDTEGKQIAWTLDTVYIDGQIGLHLENGETGEFTLHLNYSEDIKSIRIYASIYSVTPQINTPKGIPVISMENLRTMGGMRDKLFLYEDGSIIYIEEQGLRFPIPNNPATRTWKTGTLPAEELNSLLDFIKNSGFMELNDNYNYPGYPMEGSIRSSDVLYTISFVYGNLSKQVMASGYLTPDHGETSPDMPFPLNEIYRRLRIIALSTQEVGREIITP